jgi:hypothetical protein
MYIGFFNYYEVYNKNKMFTDKSSPIGDDLMYPFVYLGEHLLKKGHKINTIDMDNIRNFDAIVFMDFPTFENKYFKQLINDGFNNLYLIIFESEITKPDNWNLENHKYFKKVFTWDDEFVDNKKYFKINFSGKIPTDLNFNLNKKNKLCTMIAGHKLKSHPLELYTERIKAIRWFEQNLPEDFDLYGIGWDKYNFNGMLSRLNRFDALKKILKPRYPSYKGSIESKKEVYKKYKFAICYENARDIPGYITEKIFDCFFAGCVPIYWGAPNITDHIPANTFIDKRRSGTYEELYGYLKNMSNREYINYLDAIKDFIKSDKIYPFSAECFAETIVNEIVGGN